MLIGSKVRSDTRLLDLLLAFMPGIKEGSRYRISFTRFHVLTPRSLSALASTSMLRCLPHSMLTGVTAFHLDENRIGKTSFMEHRSKQLFKLRMKPSQKRNSAPTANRVSLHVSHRAGPPLITIAARAASSPHGDIHSITTPVSKKRNGARYVKGTAHYPSTQLCFAIHAAGP